MLFPSSYLIQQFPLGCIWMEVWCWTGWFRSRNKSIQAFGWLNRIKRSRMRWFKLGEYSPFMLYHPVRWNRPNHTVHPLALNFGNARASHCCRSGQPDEPHPLPPASPHVPGHAVQNPPTNFGYRPRELAPQSSSLRPTKTTTTIVIRHLMSPFLIPLYSSIPRSSPSFPHRPLWLRLLVAPPPWRTRLATMGYRRQPDFVHPYRHHLHWQYL